MPWTTPRTWTTSQLVTANELNTDVRDNTNHLYDRHNEDEDSTASTLNTNSTTFEQAGSINVTLTTIGKPVMLLAELRALNRSAGTDRVVLQWYNNTSAANVGSEFYCELNNKFPVVLSAVEIPTPGTYTWILRWRVTNSASQGEIEGMNLRAVELM